MSRAPVDQRPSVVHLIRAGTLDAELAALAWLMLEARVPLIVASASGPGDRATVVSALLEFLPQTAVVRHLEGGTETFAWLPEALRLGWRAPGPGRGAESPALAAGAESLALAAGAESPALAAGAESLALAAGADRISSANGYLVAGQLGVGDQRSTWGEPARIAIRALSIGYGLGATVEAASLEDLFERLGRPDVSLTADELSHLGMVLILRAFRGEQDDAIPRIAAAHYIRPVSRDSGGHLQRLRPAVLATWDEGAGSFEHFAWGVTPELAMRVGRRAGDFEAELERRRDVLSALAAAGLESSSDVRSAIDGYRLALAPHRH